MLTRFDQEGQKSNPHSSYIPFFSSLGATEGPHTKFLVGRTGSEAYDELRKNKELSVADLQARRWPMVSAGVGMGRGRQQGQRSSSIKSDVAREKCCAAWPPWNVAPTRL